VNRPYEPRGVSLVELLIAMTILSMAAAPLYLVFTNAAKNTGDGGRAVQATFLAQKVLEEIKASCRRNSHTLGELPALGEFRVVQDSSISIFETIPECIRSIHGEGRPIGPGSPFHDSYQNFLVRLRIDDGMNRGLGGKYRFWMVVEVFWKDNGKDRQVRLKGLVETFPDEFTVEKG